MADFVTKSNTLGAARIPVRLRSFRLPRAGNPRALMAQSRRAVCWLVAALVFAACGQAGEPPRGCGLEGTTALPEGSAELIYACSPGPNQRSRIDIFVVRPGEPARLLTHGGANYWPASSPDGRRIAFVSTRSGAEQLHVMNADGTGVVQITHSPGFFREVTWSPDGTKIAFPSSAAGLTGPLFVNHLPSDIYIADADGTGARRLTLNGGFNVEPAWSPDGSRIAFTSDLGGLYQVWVMGSDGSDQRPLTSVGQNFAPDWSPDGSRIVFHSDRDYLDGSQGTIYVMRADGSDQRRLGVGTGVRASWSRDGRWIAFESGMDGPSEIYAMRPDGSGLTRVTHDGVNKGKPKWRP